MNENNNVNSLGTTNSMNELESPNGMSQSNTQDSMTAINNLENKKGDSKKSKPVGMLVALLIILVIALVGVVALHQMTGSENIFKTFINSSFDYLEGNLKESQNQKGTFTLKINGTSNDTDTTEILKVLSKIDVSGEYGIDYENKMVNINIESNYDHQKLLNMSLYGEESTIYIYLEDLYDQYLQTDMEEYDSLFESAQNQKDYKNILEGIRKAMVDSLKEEYFTTSTEEIDGKTVTKTTLTIDQDNYQTVEQDVTNTLLEDNDFIQSLANLSEKEESEIREVLNNLVEETELSAELEETIEISIYTSGQNFVRLEIKDAEDSITVTKNQTQYDYKIVSSTDGTYQGSITINQNDNNVSLTILVADETNENSLEIIMTSTTEYDVDVEKQEITKFKNIDDLTTEETYDIYYKLLEQEGFTKLVADLDNSNEL